MKKIEDKTAKICVVGLGYVGLPTAIFFAEKGYDVIGADIDDGKIRKIKNKEPVYKELALTQRLTQVIENGKLDATTDTVDAVSRSDVVLITVPTPITSSKEPELGFVISAANEISKGLKKGQLIVLESTTYPGTTEEIVKPILEKTGLIAGVDFGLAYCPERYNPGDKEHTLEKVSRIVGAIDPEWAALTRKLYESIITQEVAVVKNIRTAEAAKIVENIQRDLNIALVNEFALIFEKLDIDIMDVLDAASTKWNFVRYKPGPGVGGHCLPVDPYYLTFKAKELGYYPKLILAGRAINDYMSHHVIDLISEGLNNAHKAISKSKIAIMGIAYKANTGDIRESPAVKITKTLMKMGGTISVYDPLVTEDDCQKSLNIKGTTLNEAIKDADCIVILTNHDVIVEELDMEYIKKSVKEKCVIVDTQFIFSPEEVESLGYVYRGIGRGVT